MPPQKKGYLKSNHLLKAGPGSPVDMLLKPLLSPSSPFLPTRETLANFPNYRGTTIGTSLLSDNNLHHISARHQPR